MPIKINSNIRAISQDEFHRLDYIVTGCAFAVHNEWGRFWNERIYQHELQHRCREAGLHAEVGTAINIIHKDFHKKYYVDLFINNAAIYELKSVSSLGEKHQVQLINYLLRRE